MTDAKTASEIYAQLGIEEPFKEWITQQPGFDTFESFYGKLLGGKLGKDYRLKPEQADLLLPSVPSLPKPAPVKKKKPKRNYNQFFVPRSKYLKYFLGKTTGTYGARLDELMEMPLNEIVELKPELHIPREITLKPDGEISKSRGLGVLI